MHWQMWNIKSSWDVLSTVLRQVALISVPSLLEKDVTKTPSTWDRVSMAEVCWQHQAKLFTHQKGDTNRVHSVGGLTGRSDETEPPPLPKRSPVSSQDEAAPSAFITYLKMRSSVWELENKVKTAESAHNLGKFKPSTNLNTLSVIRQTKPFATFYRVIMWLIT